MVNEKQINLEGDVVLVHHQDKPVMFARIEAIEPDIKKDWYQVTFFLLIIPPQTVTWILREEYFNGVPFTMGGQSMKIEAVKPEGIKRKAESFEHPSIHEGRKSSKVVPFKKPL